ncbi:MAG: 6-bladed beta-propeller [Tannerellaceae bacterium]|jgi:hypothetical protein|nr:6-bladed beta-propeller [Tannerellaceae bacterium]
MKSFDKLCLLAMFCIITGCGPQKANEGENATILSVVPESMKNEVKISEAFSSAKYISLETSQELLLDNIQKIDHKDRFIYVSDRFAVYKFDEDGSLLSKIKKVGPGPDEYLSVSDFEVSEDGSVWILSRSNQTLYNYTWEGEMTGNIKLNCWAAKMLLVSPEEMWLYIGNEMNENNQHQLKMINPQTGSLISSQLEIDEKQAKYLHINSENHFSRGLNSRDMYFFKVFDDNVYRLSQDSTVPALTVNINNKNIPPSFFENEYEDVMDFFQSLFNEGNYAYGTTAFTEYKNMYLYSYFYDREKRLSFISKEKKESVTDFKTIIEDANLFGYPVYLTELSLFFQKNNEIIIPLTPSDILQYAETNLSPEDLNKVKQVIRYTSDDQNPVLLLLYI